MYVKKDKFCINNNYDINTEYQILSIVIRRYVDVQSEIPRGEPRTAPHPDFGFHSYGRS